MIDSAVQIVDMALIAFSRTAGFGSGIQLMVPNFILDHELGEFKLLGSWADGYAALKKCFPFEADITPCMIDRVPMYFLSVILR